MEVGSNLRALRQRRGFNIKDIATRMGISASHLYKLENGERDFSFHMLDAAAAALNVSPWRIFAGAFPILVIGDLATRGDVFRYSHSVAYEGDIGVVPNERTRLIYIRPETAPPSAGHLRNGYFVFELEAVQVADLAALAQKLVVVAHALEPGSSIDMTCGLLIDAAMPAVRLQSLDGQYREIKDATAVHRITASVFV